MGAVVHTCLNQRTTGLLARVIHGLAACMIMSLGGACENKPADTSTVEPDSPAARTGLLRLTPEELSRMQLELVSVAQGQLLSHREFPATVQANQNELAEVTTLIRGRVMKVHVDVGQDVKKGALLAMLHSVDLGVAEGDYLKAGARLHEAELAHLRAKDLYENKAISLAELQRREAAMKTARAEVREAQNRLQLLGVPSDEIDRLERELTIKADLPLRAPFDGRVITRNITRGEVVETDQKLFTVASSKMPVRLPFLEGAKVVFAPEVFRKITRPRNQGSGGNDRYEWIGEAHVDGMNEVGDAVFIFKEGKKTVSGTIQLEGVILQIRPLQGGSFLVSRARRRPRCQLTLMGAATCELGEYGQAITCQERAIDHPGPRRASLAWRKPLQRVWRTQST